MGVDPKLSQDFQRLVLKNIDGEIRNFHQIAHAISLIKSPQRRGQMFELFSQEMLRTEPSLQVKELFRIEQAPIEILKRLGLKNGQDNGIDSIIIDRNDRLITVQDKFKSDPSDSVKWTELATFFADSVKADVKLVVTTAYRVDQHGKAPSHGQLQKILGHELEDLSSDRLARIVDAILKGVCVHVPRKAERQHQLRAIDDIVLGLNEADRALFVSACGTGKTLTAERVVERMVGNEQACVLVLMPSLNLVKQTLREWSQELSASNRYRYLAVCSDQGVAAGAVYGSVDSDDIEIPIDEMGVPVTTDVNSITEFLTRSRGDCEVKIIFATYQSSKIVGEAARALNNVFSLIVFDEAHRTVTAGKKTFVSNESYYSYALENSNVPAHKRLFMTATPKTRKLLNTRYRDRDNFVFISMDDQLVFGKVVHRYTFRQAANDGVICPFKVVISVINQDEIGYEIAAVSGSIGNVQMRFRDAAQHLAVKKAIASTGAKRVVTYHSRLLEAERFASSMKDILPGWETGFVSSKQSVKERERVIRLVRNTDNSLATNVRCLTEGVDFPAVDMVCMLSKIDSKTDIIQIAGRALRKSDDTDKQFGYVMLPILMTSGSDDVDKEVEAQGYSTIWAVISALMDDDEELSSIIEGISFEHGAFNGQLSVKMRTRLSNYIEIVGIDSDDIYSSIQTKIVDRLFSSFSYGLGKLDNYIRLNGSTSMPNGFKTEDGFGLSDWLSNRRQEWRRGSLSQTKIEQLQALGVTTKAQSELFDQRIKLLSQFINLHGHSRWPTSYVMGGQNLTNWLGKCRKKYRLGTLDKQTAIVLEELGVFQETGVYFEGLSKLEAFCISFGHGNVPRQFVSEDGFKLGRWLVSLKQQWRKGELDDSRIRSLVDNGVSPSIRDDKFSYIVSLLERYKSDHGTAEVPNGVVYHGHKLGSWLRDAKNKWRRGIYSAERIDQLTKLGICKGRATKEYDQIQESARASAFERGFEQLVLFKAKEGHPNVHQEKGMFNGFDLGSWLHWQRRNWKMGTLSQSRIEKLESLGVRKYRARSATCD